jgi:hypothetical protein
MVITFDMANVAHEEIALIAISQRDPDQGTVILLDWIPLHQPLDRPALLAPCFHAAFPPQPLRYQGKPLHQHAL